MINKENDENIDTQEPVDVADVDIQCHLLIKDIDTGETLVDQRG